MCIISTIFCIPLVVSAILAIYHDKDHYISYAFQIIFAINQANMLAVYCHCWNWFQSPKHNQDDVETGEKQPFLKSMYIQSV